MATTTPALGYYNKVIYRGVSDTALAQVVEHVGHYSSGGSIHMLKCP